MNFSIMLWTLWHQWSNEITCSLEIPLIELIITLESPKTYKETIPFFRESAISLKEKSLMLLYWSHFPLHLMFIRMLWFYFQKYSTTTFTMRRGTIKKTKCSIMKHIWKKRKYLFPRLTFFMTFLVR